MSQLELELSALAEKQQRVTGLTSAWLKQHPGPIEHAHRFQEANRKRVITSVSYVGASAIYRLYEIEDDVVLRDMDLDRDKVDAMTIPVNQQLVLWIRVDDKGIPYLIHVPPKGAIASTHSALMTCFRPLGEDMEHATLQA